ncbi:peptidyl-alpha-hydroxyglycine alpha-amidating lyase family protein [Flavitalea sp.]|nr:peptidyl-alpha-hydroxyglycine alpha-amidating lyase family protein [Flavitalea sp.]
MTRTQSLSFFAFFLTLVRLLLTGCTSVLLIGCTSVLLTGCTTVDSTDSGTYSNPEVVYHEVIGWPQLAPGFQLGNPTGIGIDTSNHIFVFHRADRQWPLTGPMPDSRISSPTILELNPVDGKIINSWGQGLFIMPHGLTIDKENNIWVTDIGLHQVIKFNHNGKLLLKIGEAGVPGNDKTHFNKPTDVAIAKNGCLYVTDGYGNNRVVKFSPEGLYMFEWGTGGKKTGEFDIPHAIDLDESGNVYIADRENSRIQVFDAAGKYINQWKNKNGKITAVSVLKNKKGFVATDDNNSWFGLRHNGSNILLFDSSGIFTKFVNRNLTKSKNKSWFHDVAVDEENNIYVGDISNNRLRKFEIKN